METSKEHADLQALMEQNRELLKENNQLLKKIYRNGVWSFWARIAWYAVIIGLPFALYFFIRDYFAILGADYDVFKQGLSEIPGLKNINQNIQNLQR